MAHNNIASIYLKTNNNELALKHLKIVNKLSPGFLPENIITTIVSN